MLNKVWEMILNDKESYEIMETKELDDKIIRYIYLNKKDGHLLEVRLLKGKPLYIELNNL